MIFWAESLPLRIVLLSIKINQHDFLTLNLKTKVARFARVYYFELFWGVNNLLCLVLQCYF